MRRNAPSKSALTRPDAGPDHAHKLMAADSALLPVGAECRVYFPGDGSHGGRAFITKGYGLHSVMADNGEYLSDEGNRFDYRPGYIVREESGDLVFCCAGQLVPTKSKDDIGHLRLVKGRKR